MAAIRACRRAMTDDERIEVAMFVHDEALFALADFVLEDKMTGNDHSSTGALWNHVKWAGECVARADERIRMRAATDGAKGGDVSFGFGGHGAAKQATDEED